MEGTAPRASSTLAVKVSATVLVIQCTFGQSRRILVSNSLTVSSIAFTVVAFQRRPGTHSGLGRVAIRFGASDAPKSLRRHYPVQVPRVDRQASQPGLCLCRAPRLSFCGKTISGTVPAINRYCRIFNGCHCPMHRLLVFHRLKPPEQFPLSLTGRVSANDPPLHAPGNGHHLGAGH